MVCTKYTAEFKINMVEEYLKEYEKSKISKVKFALEKGISDSTFNDWVIKYKKQGNGFCNITNEIQKINNVEVVEYERDIVRIEDASNLQPKECRIHYRGAILEFDEKLVNS